MLLLRSNRCTHASNIGILRIVQIPLSSRQRFMCQSARKSGKERIESSRKLARGSSADNVQWSQGVEEFPQSRLIGDHSMKWTLESGRTGRSFHFAVRPRFELLQDVGLHPRNGSPAGQAKSRPGRVTTSTRDKHSADCIEMMDSKVEARTGCLTEIDDVAPHPSQSQGDSHYDIRGRGTFVEPHYHDWTSSH